MKIRINHGEMTNVKNKLNNEGAMLLEEIEKIEGLIAELKGEWQGEEANIFYIKADNYTKKLKSVPLTYQSMSRFLERANIRYKEADIALSKEIEKIRMNG